MSTRCFKSVVALALLVLASCGGDERPTVYFEVTKGPDCTADVGQYDVIVSVYEGQPRAYAWRRGFGKGTSPLSALDLPVGTEVAVRVDARGGEADPCVRCSKHMHFTLNGDARVGIELDPAADCGANADAIEPYDRCLPGSDSYCAGKDKVACSSTGQPQVELCPLGCHLGTCESCGSKYYFRDKDGDQYGDNTQVQLACEEVGAGYVERGGDCYDDANDPVAKNVFPGQTDFFEQGYGPSKRFDYDCDGHETQMFPTGAGCQPPAALICGQSGWVVVSNDFLAAAPPPACGQSGTYLDCPTPPLTMCLSQTSRFVDQVQACH